MRTRSGRGALVWFATAAAIGALASVVVRFLTPAPALEFRPPANGVDAVMVAALGAERVTFGAVEARVELAPLYGDAARQAFEAETLRQRLALGEGQPWRLSVVAATPAALDPREIEVSDGRGQALRTIGVENPATGPSDPLRALLAAQNRPTAASRAEWLLWGRAPDAPAMLVVDGVRTPLAPIELRASELLRPLCVVQRRLDGRNAGAEASNGKRP